MIYTVTLNPSLDYVMHAAECTLGQVNRSTAEHLFPGGKGINVSRVLKSLGHESVALGFLAGDIGDIISGMLCREGITSDFLRLKSGNSRINVKLKMGEETEINAAGPQILPAELGALTKKLKEAEKGDFIVLSGSVPGGVPRAAYADIMRELAGGGARFIVDAAGEALSGTLEHRPFLIKPNRDELGELFSRRITSREAAAECAKVLQERGAENVLVSLGAEGAVLAASDGRIITGCAPHGRAVNSTGAGDSMLAGFLAGYIDGGDLERALRLGLAAGTATAFSEDLADRERILEIYDKINGKFQK